MEAVLESCLSLSEKIPAAEICQGASKAVCVGRNFVAHAKELSNPVPEAPVLFTKAPNCFVPFAPQLVLPKGLGECHHELELVFIVGQRLSAQSLATEFDANLSQGAALAAMSGLALGLDLTLRDVQSELKRKALPWTRAKNFDGAAPVTDGLRLANGSGLGDLNDLHMQLLVNDEVRQLGHLRDLIFDLDRLVAEIVAFMTLEPGDLIFTGTPAGVGPLCEGDNLVVTLWHGASASDGANAQLLVESRASVV